MLTNLRSRVGTLREFVRLSRIAERHCGRSAVAQLREFTQLRRNIGMSVREYFLYELYRPEKSLFEKSQYLTRITHERFLAPLDPPEFRDAFADKLAFKHRFDLPGIRVPRSYGFFHPHSDRADVGRVLRNRCDLSEVLASIPFERGLVIKPIRGGCGTDVLVFREIGPNAKGATRSNGEVWTVDQLAQFLSRAAVDGAGFLLEERIAQHSLLASWNPATLNTLRVVTLIDSRGKTHVVGATLKIGADDSGVDSLVEEHLCAAVDWPMGRVGTTWQCQNVEFVATSEHPGSRVAIDGAILPYWADVQSLVERASQIIPQIRSVGWDIGFAEDGPVLIEGNEIWGEEILQIPLRRGIWTSEFRGLIGA